jgi:hypothetical protein
MLFAQVNTRRFLSGFKNGIATHLEKETVKKKDALSVLKETVNGQSFGTITLTQKDGKVINLKNVATEKL